MHYQVKRLYSEHPGIRKLHWRGWDLNPRPPFFDATCVDELSEGAFIQPLTLVSGGQSYFLVIKVTNNALNLFDLKKMKFG